MEIWKCLLNSLRILFEKYDPFSYILQSSDENLDGNPDENI